MKYQKGKNNRKKVPFAQNNRSAIIMLNAAVVLIVVIVAMIIQLVHLNGRPQPQKTMESQTADTQTPAESANPEDNPEGTSEDAPKVERIRKNLDKDKPMVALTFDDGPYDKVTDRIVKALAKNDSRATFFVVGNRVEKYADTLKNAYVQGNQIATHTFDHKDLSKMKTAGIKKEINRSKSVIQKIIGEGPALLRPPYGNVNDKMRKSVKMPMIYWSVDTQDWKSRNKKSILKESKSIEDGDIVLMHDLYPTTAAAVEALVPRLRKKGFQLVTVEELFYYKEIDAGAGKVYFSGK